MTHYPITLTGRTYHLCSVPFVVRNPLTSATSCPSCLRKLLQCPKPA
jgi:hypothetical protein